MVDRWEFKILAPARITPSSNLATDLKFEAWLSPEHSETFAEILAQGPRVAAAKAPEAKP